MEFKEALSKLKSSEIFKKWSSENKECYLVHGFVMIDPSVKKEWQIGFYDPKDDTVLTFSIGDTIIQNPGSEVFKEEKGILELDPSKVEISFDKALETAHKLQKEKYSAHTSFKEIVLLQNLKLGQVWNITFITGSFKTLNIKIDSLTGEVLKEDLLDLFTVEK